MRPITPTEQTVLDFITKHIYVNGYPPTRNEIANGFNWRSANNAEEHLQSLARKGALRLNRGIARGITLTPTETEQAA